MYQGAPFPDELASLIRMIWLSATSCINMTPHDAEQISWSLGETAALATKAARGAGMPWGLADETGVAVSWLHAHGIPGLRHYAGI